MISSETTTTTTKTTKTQFSMPGVDAEVGYHFFMKNNIDLYAGIGPYYFDGDCNKMAIGGKGRITARFKDFIYLAASYSNDTLFHSKFQGEIGLSIPFGSKKSSETNERCSSFSNNWALQERLLQPVPRQEIIVVSRCKQKKVLPSEATIHTTTAINPETGLPWHLVFVDNTSSSEGTYESPYPTLVQVENNSSPNDIIYVFPGDGTTKGMDSGIALQANQTFWGSGVSHSIVTSEGIISIPAQSSLSPTITNTNIDTDGNAITLASNNAISGFTITSAINDAIYGANSQTLNVSSCLIENSNTYAIEAYFPGDASLSLTNNEFLNNTNGVALGINGTSILTCSHNSFTGQTSISSIPLEIVANNNTLTAQIENNNFNNNMTGSIIFVLDNITSANISLLNNTISNNGTGSLSNVASSFVILPNGTNDNCSIVLRDNTFANNAAATLYLEASGAFTTLDITASANTMTNNGAAAISLGTPVDTLTLVATNNVINGGNDNAIAVISSGSTSTGNITINNNTITNIGNASNAVAINQDFSTLNLTLLNNEINGCEGSGISIYAPDAINSLILNVSGNSISNCQNDGGNAASGISVDTYLNLTSTIANNTLSDNATPGVAVGYFTSGNPAVCLTLTGNSSDTDPGYSLTNPGNGIFNLSPCNVDDVNTGMIDVTGTISPVQSCPNAAPCSP